MPSFSLHTMLATIAILFLTATPSLSGVLCNKGTTATSEQVVVAHLEEDSTGDGITLPADDDRIKVAVLCYLRGEEIRGLNKICFYDCAGDGYAITIDSLSLCPLDINR